MSLFKTGIRPSIDEYLLKLAAEKRNYGEYWSASSAGYCMRRNIMERLGVPHVTEDARKQRVFTSGHIFHEWIQDITNKAGLSIASEVELQDEDLMIRGHFDDLVLVHKDFEPGQVIPIKDMRNQNKELKAAQQHLILYDYKTVNSKSFTWAKKNGGAMSYYHKMQLGTYMYMLRTGWSKLKLWDIGNTDLTEARILKISKDDLRMDEQQLLWSDELATEVTNYWQTLNKYWESKKLPPCTCADHEGGFLAREAFNPFFFEGAPCSIAWYKKSKKELL